jgi:MFS transporter, ACS family, glucarate transporter
VRATAVRWRILAIMVFAALVSYVLRLNVSIAGEAMIHDLSLTPVHLGLILSAFAWGYGIFQVPGGLFGEWLGPRLALTIVIALWGVLTVLTALLPPAGTAPAVIVGAAVTLRFFMGVAQAPIFPVTCGSSVRVWFPPTGWALPNAFITLGTTLGGVVAGPVVAWLVLGLGWRQSFVVTAPLALVCAALWWWQARDDPSEHPAVNQAELALVKPAGIDTAEAPLAPGEWKAVLLQRDVLLLTASYFCMNYVFYLFFNWFFFYLTDVRGFDAQVSGYFTGAQWMVGAVAALAGGVACDVLARRFGSRLGCRVTAMAGLVACAGLLVAGAFAPNPVVAVALLSCSFGGAVFTDVAFWVAAMLVAGRHAPAATGLLNTGGNVAGGLGAVAVPLVAAAFGWTAAVASGAAFALLAAALWLWVRAEIPASPPMGISTPLSA